MNTLFIDISKNNLFKIKIKEDIFSNLNVNSSNICIKFNKSVLFDMNYFTKKCIELYIYLFFNVKNKRYRKLEKINIIFSERFENLLNENNENNDNNYNFKEYIINYLKKYLNIFEIKKKNQMYLNDQKYIKKYIDENFEKNKEIEKIKKINLGIVININKINNYNKKEIFLLLKNKILEYIKLFKNVDVLIDLNKKDNEDLKYYLKEIKNIIEDINDEYGTCIQVKKRKDIQEYDIYILLNNVIKSEFRKKHILKRNSIVIDFNSIEDDDFNIYNLNYIKMYENIKTDLNRLNLDILNFSKNKLGQIY